MLAMSPPSTQWFGRFLQTHGRSWVFFQEHGEIVDLYIRHEVVRGGTVSRRRTGAREHSGYGTASPLTFHCFPAVPVAFHCFPAVPWPSNVCHGDKR